MLNILGALVLFTPQQADLGQDILRILDDPALSRASVGVFVKELDGAVLFDRNADKRLIPASVMKLVTSVLALETLGPSYRPKTTAWKMGKKAFLVGGADPGLTVEELLGIRRRLGIARGDTLVFDDGLLGSDRINLGWEYGDMMRGDAAPVSALTVNYGEAVVVAEKGRVFLEPRNFGIQILRRSGQGELVLHRDFGSWMLKVKNQLPGTRRLGSVSLPDPALCAAKIVSSSARRGKAPGPPANALVHSPRDVAEILHETMRNSNNHCAETLLRLCGAVGGESGSWDDSLALAEKLLSKAGISPEAYRLSDGCGLSRFNEITSRALVHLLEWELLRKHGPILEASLAKSGEGTLRNRLLGLDVLAKTGTLSGVCGIVGIATPAPDMEKLGAGVPMQRKRVLFAILFNHYAGKAARPRELQDAIIERICRLPEHSPARGTLTQPR
ncbi:MAG: D-alanyl-D-alanine carboxypeptidase [Armatimonadetes bacterium]|nr:D-alanyl-D-alanine carboxypeptidase [Armatimonadota bacterium]